MTVIKMVDLDLAGKRVLIREDLNVPVKDGKVTSEARIRASLPTIQHAMQAGAKVMLMSHLGRPTEGEFKAEDSLQPVADRLGEMLGKPVRLISDYLQNAPQLADGEVVILENVRINKGEKKNNPDLAKQYAGLCDIYVMDAFATSHRAEASTEGAGRYAPVACAGVLLAAELDALTKALKAPARPLVAIVGGSKVSTKLTVLDSLSKIVDQLIPGGGIANTFIAAAGYNVGKSLVEVDLIPEAKRLMEVAKAKGSDIPVPVDVVVGKKFDPGEPAVTKLVSEVTDDDMIFDIGPQTAKIYADMMEKAGSVVWNGPLGVFEFDQFSQGTEIVGRAIAASSAFSLAGGGDTIAALEKFNIFDQISYVSTAGGAFLEFLEGKTLPAVAMLEERARG